MARRMFMVAGLALLSLAGDRASAGPLDKRLVGAEARWVVHVDVEAFVRSSLGKMVLNDPARFDLSDLEEVKREFGVDPFQDAKGVTIYGTDESDHVIVLATSAAVDGAIEKVMAKTQGFERLVEGGMTIYTWHDGDAEGDGGAAGGTRQYLYLGPGRGDSERLVIITESKDRLMHGIAVAERKAKSLADGGGEEPTLGSPHAGSIVFVAGNDPEALDWHNDKASEIARSAKAFALDLGEHEGKLFADAMVTTGSEQDATNVAQMAQGLVALGRLLAGSEPEAAEAMKLLDLLRITADGKTISAEWRYDTDALMELIPKLEKLGEGGGDDADKDEGAKAETPKDKEKERKSHK